MTKYSCFWENFLASILSKRWQGYGHISILWFHFSSSVGFHPLQFFWKLRKYHGDAHSFWCPSCRFRAMDPFNEASWRKSSKLPDLTALLEVSAEGILHCALLGAGGYDFELFLGLILLYLGHGCRTSFTRFNHVRIQLNYLRLEFSHLDLGQCHISQGISPCYRSGEMRVRHDKPSNLEEQRTI